MVLYLHEPLLFWTIIAIALRRPATGVSPMSFLLPLSLSYDALANHVTKMAGEVATKPSRSGEHPPMEQDERKYLTRGRGIVRPCKHSCSSASGRFRRFGSRRT